jgi:hypothetical protein
MKEPNKTRLESATPLYDWMKTAQVHPKTGEPFIGWLMFESEQPTELVHYFAQEPQPPGPTCVESFGVDEDGEDCELERERTPEEMAAAQAEYVAAHARWVADGRKTGMQQHRISTGPAQTTVQLVTATGALAVGMRLGDAQASREDWHWLAWDS